MSTRPDATFGIEHQRTRGRGEARTDFGNQAVDDANVGNALAPLIDDAAAREHDLRQRDLPIR
jgi:hypothetical protein